MSKFLAPLELTLAIIKPDVCRNPYNLQLIRQIILENNFYFVDTRVTQLNPSEAEKFYAEHKNKFFFNRLSTFMSSGLLSAHILARENAIKHWRDLMGPTHVYKAQFDAPHSIRARFGLTDTRNACHGSDSPDTARREISFFFPDFNMDDFFKYHEETFRNNDVVFDAARWIHKIRDAKAQQI
uniref:Nucleoside diphosphate kinase n=1 Tax=Parasteatoda tepidariorum TaxID=114398 RepID=A0A2L2XWA4_PARTP